MMNYKIGSVIVLSTYVSYMTKMSCSFLNSDALHKNGISLILRILVPVLCVKC